LSTDKYSLIHWIALIAATRTEKASKIIVTGVSGEKIEVAVELIKLMIGIVQFFLAKREYMQHESILSSLLSKYIKYSRYLNIIFVIAIQRL
jgi:hypothetical protein